jgi:hypothetical protein
MLDYVVDEGVQIHGGYGYHQDYAVERAYRDSRINRIFEGHQRDQSSAGHRHAAEARATRTVAAGGGCEEVAGALGVAYQKFMNALEDQQEVLAGLTDIMMNAFAMESVLLRTQKLAANGKGEVATQMCPVFLREAMETVESAARTVLAASSEGDALRTNLAVLKRFTKFEPVNAIAVRQKIAARLLEADRYAV